MNLGWKQSPVDRKKFDEGYERTFSKDALQGKEDQKEEKKEK